MVGAGATFLRVYMAAVTLGLPGPLLRIEWRGDMRVSQTFCDVLSTRVAPFSLAETGLGPL